MDECKCLNKDKELGWHHSGIVCTNCGLHAPGEAVILTQADYDKMIAVVEAWKELYDIVNAVVGFEYTPARFTAQPMRTAPAVQQLEKE